MAEEGTFWQPSRICRKSYEEVIRAYVRDQEHLDTQEELDFNQNT